MRPTKLTRKELEAKLGVRVRRGWVLDGPGPARYGWVAIHPCRESYLGATLESAWGKVRV